MKPTEVITKITKITVFVVSLCFVTWLISSLYLKNYNRILDGTYVYDRFETPLMMVPVLMVFLFIIYLGVKIYGKNTGKLKKYK